MGGRRNRKGEEDQSCVIGKEGAVIIEVNVRGKRRAMFYILSIEKRKEKKEKKRDTE